MSKRREFDKPTKVAIVKRATRKGEQFCEGCGVLCKGAFEIDHTDPDAMQIDKTRKLTANDGKLLCLECHRTKTAVDKANIAKAKRNEAAHLGVKGSKTGLEGRSQDEKRAAREAKSSGKNRLAPRSLYVDN